LLRLYLRLVTPEENENAALGPGVFERDDQQRLDELSKLKFTGNGLRGLSQRENVNLL